MFTVIGITRNRADMEESVVSTGFANRGEASRFATGLAKTGKIVRAEIREDPDPDLRTTAKEWRKRVDRLIQVHPQDPELLRTKEDVELLLGVLNGGVHELLLLAHRRAEADLRRVAMDKAEKHYKALDRIAEAIADTHRAMNEEEIGHE